MFLSAIFTVFFLFGQQFSNAQTLKLVNLVYRHGDRSPVNVFPTDPNTEAVWPQGLGWLSKVGMDQQYALGKWLHDRYMVNFTGFMNETYKNYEITVQSSDVNRTLMSAYCNLAGLYPPDPNNTWNPSLSWQPIPVHTRPTIEDNMLNMGAPCPRYDELYEEAMNSEVIKEEERKNKAFYQFVGKESGYGSEDVATLWKIGDCLFCEKQHEFTWASWVNETIARKIANVSHWQFDLLFSGKERSRLKGGPLLKDMIKNMQSFVDGTNNRTKMFMYSAHDSTVAALANALQVFNLIQPPYTTTLIMELYEDNSGGYYVQMIYKNTTSTTYTLNLPGCTTSCPLDQFIQLTKDRVPVDWNAECKAKKDDNSTCELGLIIIIVLGVLLLVLVLAVLFVQTFNFISEDMYTVSVQVDDILFVTMNCTRRIEFISQ
ncbi:hypothetical protein ScPMuIL_015418 [Solemya velum]